MIHSEDADRLSARPGDRATGEAIRARIDAAPAAMAENSSRNIRYRKAQPARQPRASSSSLKNGDIPATILAPIRTETWSSLQQEGQDRGEGAVARALGQ
ncbi:hypothetical protein [Paralimibaculum aggregatum]|uniref:hypothetical protein n=1 Tax=Paralimibaculum aggregatum TaxID=3036245 RepID=UPI002557B6DE|nr:hypothetical protein [Limibaculum sp. NKW23]